MKSIEEVREFFSKDRYAAAAGAYVEEAGERCSVCSLELNENHLNAYGGVMGAVYFTLADFAFAVASNAYLDEPDVVAVSVNIAYMNAAKGKRLTARAECLKEGRSTCVYNVSVSDDTGREVAAVQCTGFHTKQGRK